MLREYQIDAVRDVGSAFESGAASVLLVSPTGSGKGTMGVACVLDAAKRQQPVLWFTHRRELIEDTSSRLRRAGLPEHSVLLPGAPRAEGAVSVASIQTLLASGDRPAAELLICDEAHRMVAPSYRELRAAYPNARLLGLTATPERADGTALGDVFECMIVAAQTAELVQAGYLVPVHVIAPNRRRGGLSMSPEQALATYAGDRRTVVFAANVAHAREIASAVGGVAIDGTMPLRQRRDALERFRDGALRRLINVYTLVEGWDCPEAEVCVIARGCSASMYLQMGGRVMRPAEGKRYGIMIDLCGVVHEHGLPDDPRRFSLCGRPICDVDSLPALKHCKRCLAIFRSAAICPRCGASAPPPPPPKMSPAELARIGATVPRERKQQVFNSLCSTARVSGYHPGWIAHQFKARFGHWPHGFKDETCRH
jgi:superfamily II DNA or RNA helicase